MDGCIGNETVGGGRRKQLSIGRSISLRAGFERCLLRTGSWPFPSMVGSSNEVGMYFVYKREVQRPSGEFSFSFLSIRLQSLQLLLLQTVCLTSRSLLHSTCHRSLITHILLLSFATTLLLLLLSNLLPATSPFAISASFCHHGLPIPTELLPILSHCSSFKTSICFLLPSAPARLLSFSSRTRRICE